MSKEIKNAKSAKITTPEFRVSFPAVFKPKAFGEGEPKYSIVMLFDKKKADLSALKKAYAEAATAKWGDKSKWPKNLRNPFRDGDEKAETEGYEGCTFISASSKQRPGLVDQQLNPILTEDAFYGGCYARATLTAFAYDWMGNKGVSFGLQNIQKIRDGEAFSGRKRAEDDFEALEGVETDSEKDTNADDLDL
jgi:hypothetical protein